jgi:hypothetical protein
MIMAQNRYENQWNQKENHKLQPSDLCHRSQRYTLEKRQPLQHMVLGKFGFLHAED